MFWKKKDEELEMTSQPVNTPSQEWSGNAEADLEKIKAKLEVLDAYRKTESEHAARVSEELGELRAQILELQKSIEKISIDSSKAIDLVNAVQPQNLMKEVQKEDAKLEELKSELKVAQEMQKVLKSQLQDIKKVTDAFKGAESLLELEKEIREELVSLQKLRATVERHAEKSEDIFVEFQKQYAQFLEFKDMTKDLQASFEAVLEDFDKVKVKQAEMVTKEEFKAFSSQSREQITKALNIVNESKQELAQYAQTVQELKTLIAQAKEEEKKLAQAESTTTQNAPEVKKLEQELSSLREEFARLAKKVQDIEASSSTKDEERDYGALPPPPQFEEKAQSQLVQVEEDDLEKDLPPPPHIKEQTTSKEVQNTQEQHTTQTKPQEKTLTQDSKPETQEFNIQVPQQVPPVQSSSTIPLYSKAQVCPFFKGQVLEVNVAVVGKDGSGIAREKGFTILIDNAKKGKMRVKIERIFNNNLIYAVPTIEPVSEVSDEPAHKANLPT
ncbi:hypothetical protein D6774_03955, partial [Candidatus Woesearchaeota archaeon]